MHKIQTVLKQWYESLPSYQKQEYDAGTLAVPTLDFIPDSLRDQVKMTKGKQQTLKENCLLFLAKKNKNNKKCLVR